MHTNPEVLALLALGEDNATPDERAHVDVCPICRRDLAELAHLTGVGRAVEDARPLESPSPEVWRRIQAELGFRVTDSAVIPVAPPGGETAVPPGATAADPVTPVPAPDPVATPDLDEATETGRALIGPSTPADADLITLRRPGDTSPPSGRSSRRRRLLALALAAVLALVVGFGLGLGWNAASRPSATVIGQAELQPGNAAWDGATGEATLERDANGERVLIVRATTPRPVPGIRTVWIMDNSHKNMQTVGQLAGSEGRFTIDPATNLADFPVVDVSEEPANDVDPLHSGITILRGTLSI